MEFFDTKHEGLHEGDRRGSLHLSGVLLITGQENLHSNLGHIAFRNGSLLSKIKESNVVECFVFGKKKGRSNAFGIYCVSVPAALFLLSSLSHQFEGNCVYSNVCYTNIKLRSSQFLNTSPKPLPQRAI